MKFILFSILVTLVLCGNVRGQTNSFDFSVHVIDTGKGRAAPQIPVKLYKSKGNDDWTLVTQGKTGTNGRLDGFTSTSAQFTAGTYKFSFRVKEYYTYAGQETIFPTIDIIFEIQDTKQHYHIPLLLNAYGYSTYRGS